MQQIWAEKKTQEAEKTELEIITESFPLEEVVQAPASTYEGENVPFNNDEMIIENFYAEEITYVTYTTEPASDSADAFDQIQFDGYGSNSVLSDGQKYTVSAETMLTLDIVKCIWTPEETMIHFGFYNPETNTGYAYAQVGGNVSGELEFSELPAGEYIVYVKIEGNETISDGTMRYNVG